MTWVVTNREEEDLSAIRVAGEVTTELPSHRNHPCVLSLRGIATTGGEDSDPAHL